MRCTFYLPFNAGLWILGEKHSQTECRVLSGASIGIENERTDVDLSVFALVHACSGYSDIVSGNAPKPDPEAKIHMRPASTQSKECVLFNQLQNTQDKEIAQPNQRKTSMERIILITGEY